MPTPTLAAPVRGRRPVAAGPSTPSEPPSAPHVVPTAGSEQHPLSPSFPSMEVLSAAAAEQERWLRSGSEYIGRRCLRCSGEREVTGRIEAWLPEEDGAPALWRCRHDDGDEEDLDEAEVRAALAAAGSEHAGSNPNAPTPAAASAAGLVSVSPNRPSRGSPGSVRSRRPASASLVQAIAMCQHKQRVVAERRAQAKSICAALVGKRVIVQWNEDEAYAGEAAVDADGSHPTSGEQTILVKYDDGEEIEETIEPHKFREIPKAYKYPACETCGGDELARLRFCEGCEAAHHEGCAMHAISVQCGRNALLRKEWFCTKCTAKQADCKACKGGRCAHTCEDGPWRVRHARYGKGGNQPRTPGATWCRPTAYRLPRLLGSSSRAHAHTRTLSFGGGLQEEKWSAEEDENLRLLVERQVKSSLSQVPQRVGTHYHTR